MDYVKVNGKTRPFLLGMAAISEVERITGQNCFTEKISVTTEFMVAITFCGFKHGARREGIPYKETFDDVADLMDEDVNITSQAMKLYMKQVLKQEPKEEGSEGEVQPLAVNQ